jgi:hypothetical protein
MDQKNTEFFTVVGFSVVFYFILDIFLFLNCLDVRKRPWMYKQVMWTLPLILESHLPIKI